jgi:ParB-like chromosome segregation protein Spo0J
MVKISNIHINPSNPRIIKDDRFKKLVKSIQEFPKMMSLRPIIIDAEGMILGGNMRFKALQELGYKEVPDEWVKRASELTDEEKQRFIIEDNVPFGEWDWETLANEWDQEKLAEWGLEILSFDYNPENKEKEINQLNTEHECPSCGYKW